MPGVLTKLFDGRCTTCLFESQVKLSIHAAFAFELAAAKTRTPSLTHVRRNTASANALPCLQDLGTLSAYLNPKLN